MKEFKLRIITPERTVFDGAVTSVVVPGALGSMGILANHAPLVSPLETGEAKVTLPDGTVRYYLVSGGFVEVADNDARILADVGEAPDQIDETRARQAEVRARERLKHRKDPEFDLARAEASLTRALMRIRIVQKYRVERHERGASGH
jgi:F-type H+-transporting ATPase subunit epsilon